MNSTFKNHFVYARMLFGGSTPPSSPEHMCGWDEVKHDAIIQTEIDIIIEVIYVAPKMHKFPIFFLTLSFVFSFNSGIMQKRMQDERKCSYSKEGMMMWKTFGAEIYLARLDLFFRCKGKKKLLQCCCTYPYYRWGWRGRRWKWNPGSSINPSYPLPNEDSDIPGKPP